MGDEITAWREPVERKYTFGSPARSCWCNFNWVLFLIFFLSLIIQLASAALYILNTPIVGVGLGCRYGENHLPINCCHSSANCSYVGTLVDLPCRITYGELTKIPTRFGLYSFEIATFFSVILFSASLPLLWLLFILPPCFRQRKIWNLWWHRFPNARGIPRIFKSHVPNSVQFLYFCLIWPFSLLSFGAGFVCAYYHHTAARAIKDITNGTYCQDPTCNSLYSNLLNTDQCNTHYMLILTLVLIGVNFIMGVVFIILMLCERPNQPAHLTLFPKNSIGYHGYELTISNTTNNNTVIHNPSHNQTAQYNFSKDVQEEETV